MEGLAHPAGGGVPIKWKCKCATCSGTGQIGKRRSRQNCPDCDGLGHNVDTLILQPLTVRDLATCENHLLAKRKNPMAVARELVQGLAPELAKDILQQAYQDGLKAAVVSRQEVAAWLDTVQGVAFTVWLSLQKSYGDRFKHDDVYDVIWAMADEELQEISELRDLAAGMDELGNSAG